MSHFDSVLEQIRGQTANAFWTVALSTVAFMLLGFVLGVLLVVVCGRKRVFERDFRVWSWLVKLNYVYIPLLFLAFGGISGSVYGAQRVTHGWIDASTAPVVTYAQALLPTTQEIINRELSASRGENITLNGLLARTLMDEDESNPIVREAMAQLNLAIIQHTVDYLLPEMAADPISAIGRIDVTNVDPRTFELLPRTLHSWADAFFYGKFLLISILLLACLVLPTSEFLLHLAVRRIRTGSFTRLQAG